MCPCLHCCREKQGQKHLKQEVASFFRVRTSYEAREKCNVLTYKPLWEGFLSLTTRKEKPLKHFAVRFGTVRSLLTSTAKKGGRVDSILSPSSFPYFVVLHVLCR